MTINLNKTYLIVAIILFIIEILIATLIKGGFIRHTFGDYLVVILLYCFLKIFIKNNTYNIALSVLIFSFIIEFLQLPNILKLLNLQHNKVIKILLGSSFQISDLVAYTLGILTVLIVEFKNNNHE